jgi:hypothetical protein
MHRTLISRTGAAFVAAGLFAISAYAAFQDIGLRAKPKAGDVRAYKVVATFQTEQGEISFNQNRKETIGEVKPDGGYTMKAITSDTKISFGGQELPEQPESTSTEEFGPDGMMKSFTADLAGA